VRNIVFSLLAVSMLWVGGCISVARMPNGELAPVIPLGGEVAESNWTKIGNAAASAAPYADLLVPGLGTAITAALAAGGWGAYRDFKGERKSRERENAAWDEATSYAMARQAPPTQGAPNGQ